MFTRATDLNNLSYLTKFFSIFRDAHSIHHKLTGVKFIFYLSEKFKLALEFLKGPVRKNIFSLSSIFFFFFVFRFLKRIFVNHENEKNIKVPYLKEI